jgi:transposase
LIKLRGAFSSPFLWSVSRPEISCHFGDLFMKQATPLNRKRTQRDYTLAFKLSVVRQVEKGEMTYKQVQTKYGIQGKSTVLSWLRKHGKLDWVSARVISMPKEKETPEHVIKRLEQEVQDLKDLNYLKDQMLKEVDRLEGTDYRKKYLSAAQKRHKRKKK